MGESMKDVKRFYIARDKELNMIIKDRENELVQIFSLEDAAYMLNKLQDELENLKHYFIVNQQAQDDGSFHVWEVPPNKGKTTWTTGSELK